MYIFIDESGDLGHRGLADISKSKYFVLVGLCCKDPQKVAKCVIKTRNTLKRPDKVLELKFSASHPETRRRMLENLALQNIDIHGIVVDKTTVFPSLMDKKEIYFNWVSGYLARKLISGFQDGEEVDIIVDKRSFGQNQEDFDKYINYKIRVILGDRWKINISHKNSHNELCLQATDFLAGTIHRKYRYGDASLFEIIKKKTNIEEMHKPLNNKSDAP